MGLREELQEVNGQLREAVPLARELAGTQLGGLVAGADLGLLADEIASRIAVEAPPQLLNPPSLTTQLRQGRRGEG